VARGWESKSVEEQIALARDRHAEASIQQLNAEQLDTERKRDMLRLQITRMKNQIETCGEGRYRTTLEAGLNFLEKQLVDLG
jgi:hypothetical protein